MDPVDHSRPMTDEDLMDAKELDTIARHLRLAGKALEDLEKRCGRKLFIFIGSGIPCVMDAERDEANNSDSIFASPRGNPITEMGSVVRSFPRRPGSWDGGDF